MSLYIPDITYIDEVISVKPEKGSYALIHPDKEYVRVKMIITPIYQPSEIITKVFEKKRWEKIQVNGSYGSDATWVYKERRGK